MVFLDEAGYTPDWKSGIEEQPYYVLSAVSVPVDILPSAYDTVRKEIEDMKLPGQRTPLGRGFEIKARDVAQGSGWWRDHNEERNQVRDLMLSFPKNFDGTAFVVIVDKKAHLYKYAFPEDPYLLALQFIFERLEFFLRDNDDFGYCVYDQNKRLEKAIQAQANQLMVEGSHGIRYWGNIIVLPFEFTLEIGHILEISFGDSRYSIGLQVADYFATMTYTYYKSGKPAKCGWWELLLESLHRKDGKLLGIGLKEFP
jgi:hypothetical protein